MPMCPRYLFCPSAIVLPSQHFMPNMPCVWHFVHIHWVEPYGSYYSRRLCLPNNGASTCGFFGCILLLSAILCRALFSSLFWSLCCTCCSTLPPSSFTLAFLLAQVLFSLQSGGLDYILPNPHLILLWEEEACR